MSHKADASFFDHKRSWSQRKDKILAYYLEPYLAKLASTGRPLLVVDGFAGPGKFSDGKPGSPLIICAKIQQQLARPTNKSPIHLICIEDTEKLFRTLEQYLAKFKFAEPRHGGFAEFAKDVENLATSCSVFLYLDPWTVEGLDWNLLDRIFEKVQSDQASVEILLNFNSASFVRRALAVLAISKPEGYSEDDVLDEIDAPFTTPPSVEKLNVVTGGDWWRSIITGPGSYAHKVNQIADQFCTRLRTRFQFCGKLAIRENESDLIPKYYLVFASRHRDGFILMNDAMVKTRKESVFYTDIFAESDLIRLIIERTEQWIRRGDLILGVIDEVSCTYSWPEIRGIIERMLRNKMLASETGKLQINDEVRVRQSGITAQNAGTVTR